MAMPPGGWDRKMLNANSTGSRKYFHVNYSNDHIVVDINRQILMLQIKNWSYYHRACEAHMYALFNPYYQYHMLQGKWLTRDLQNPGIMSSVRNGTIAPWWSPTVGTVHESVSIHRRGDWCIGRSGHRLCSFLVAPGLRHIRKVSLCFFLHGRTRKSLWMCMAENRTGPLGTDSRRMGDWERSTWYQYAQRHLWGSHHMWCSSRLKTKYYCLGSTDCGKWKNYNIIDRCEN